MAIARGLSPVMADFSLGMFRAARRGEFETVDPTLARILGRPTLPVEHTLRELLESHASTSAGNTGETFLPAP